MSKFQKRDYNIRPFLNDNVFNFRSSIIDKQTLVVPPLLTIINHYYHSYAIINQSYTNRAITQNSEYTVVKQQFNHNYTIVLPK